MLVTVPYSWIIKKIDYGEGHHISRNFFMHFPMANKTQEQENTEECYINTFFG
jgi:hypothetical protein